MDKIGKGGHVTGGHAVKKEIKRAGKGDPAPELGIKKKFTQVSQPIEITLGSAGKTDSGGSPEEEKDKLTSSRKKSMGVKAASNSEQ